MSRKASAATPAISVLQTLGVQFEAHSYRHDPAVTDFGREAAEALGVPVERVFKTLLANADGKLVVGIVPVSGQLDLKALAAAVGSRKAVMAEAALAERKTGYVIGGISPIGQRTKLPTALDTSVLDFETVFVSGGRRGLDIELAPDDLARATAAILAPIAR